MRLFAALLEQVYGGKKTPKKNKKSTAKRGTTFSLEMSLEDNQRFTIQ